VPPPRGSLFAFRSLSFRSVFLPFLGFADFVVIFFLWLWPCLTPCHEKSFVAVASVLPQKRPEVTRKKRKSFENPPSLRLPGVASRGVPATAGRLRMSRIGERLSDWVICGSRMRSRFYVNESSFRLAAECCGFATANPSCGGLAACAPRSGKIAKALGVTAAAATERFPFRATDPPSQDYGAAGYLLAALAAATILSKRGSPRRESQHGLKRRSPYDGPAGIFATISSCSSARSRSPVHA